MPMECPMERSLPPDFADGMSAGSTDRRIGTWHSARPNTDKMAGDGCRRARPRAGDKVGESVDECVAPARRWSRRPPDAERLAPALADGDGDLLGFGQILLTKHGVGRNEFAAALGQAVGLPVADTEGSDLDKEIVGRLEETVARKHKVMPIAAEGGMVIVYAADCRQSGPRPRRPPARSSCGRPPTTRRSRRSSSRCTAPTPTSTCSSPRSPRTKRAFQAGEDAIAEVSLDDQAPVVQLVLASSVRRCATAAPTSTSNRSTTSAIRFRIDGHLVEAFSLPMSAHNPLISRLKIMSEMNIVEKRAPQDGQFSTKVDGRPLDVRVASVSTVFGEKIVMRLLDKWKSMVGLAELGMPRETYKTYSKLVHAPFGMVICAGPTGAGKTTTLYATLLEINTTARTSPRSKTRSSTCSPASTRCRPTSRPASRSPPASRPSCGRTPT